MEEKLEAQGIADALKLFDKDLIDKILAISKMIRVEKISDKMTRISIDIVEKD